VRCAVSSDSMCSRPLLKKTWAATTSNEAGSMILEEWKMPESVCVGVRDHYRPTEASGAPAAMLHIACMIAQQLGKGIHAELRQWAVTPEILTLARLDEATVETVKADTLEALGQLKNRLRGK